MSSPGLFGPLQLTKHPGTAVGGSLCTKKNRTPEVLVVGAMLMTIGCGLLSTLSGGRDIEAKQYGFEVILGSGFGFFFASLTQMINIENKACNLGRFNSDAGCPSSDWIFSGSPRCNQPGKSPWWLHGSGSCHYRPEQQYHQGSGGAGVLSTTSEYPSLVGEYRNTKSITKGTRGTSLCELVQHGDENMLLCVYRDGVGRHSDLDTEPDSHTATSINRHIIRTAKSKSVAIIAPKVKGKSNQ